MKELSIEEKAKAYDEVRDKIALRFGANVAKEIFSQFEESKDERIRKYMIKYFEANKDELSKGFRWNGITVEECIAWLEKQIEQKPAWSKKDEIGLYDALWAIQQARTIAKDENDMGNLWYAEEWLKSLIPQNRWKPSEEQMGALRWVLNNVPYNKHKEEISGLLDQIKGL